MWATVVYYTSRPPERNRRYRWQTKAMTARFLQMSDVAEELSVSLSQVYHMVRSGELPAIKVGGRGQWRIERAKLEEYIERKYSETADWVRDNPLLGRDEEPE